MLLSWKLYPTSLFQDFAIKPQQRSSPLLLMQRCFSVPNNNQNPDYQQDYSHSETKTPQTQPWELLSLLGGLVGVLSLPGIHRERNRSWRRHLLAVFNMAPTNCTASQPSTAQGQGEKVEGTFLFLPNHSNEEHQCF